MDRYQAVRELPLLSVLSTLGFNGFKSRKGKAEHFGKCPFHNPEKNNTAFSFHADGRFNCFSCGESGKGAIDLVMKLKKVGFKNAIEILVPLSEVSSVSQNTPDKTEVESGCVENKPFVGTYEKFYVPSDWLKARGLSDKALEFYGIGEYRNPSRKSAYSGKVLFPIRRFKDGCKVGYLARTIEENSTEPKYMLPSGLHKSLELFGAWQIREQYEGQVQHLGFVVESPLCVARFYDLGFLAVSPYGWSVSPEQLEILCRLFQGVVYLPDRDKYQSVGPTLQSLAARLWVKSPILPEGVNDPEKLSVPQLAALLKSVRS